MTAVRLMSTTLIQTSTEYMIEIYILPMGGGAKVRTCAIQRRSASEETRNPPLPKFLHSREQRRSTWGSGRGDDHVPALLTMMSSLPHFCLAAAIAAAMSAQQDNSVSHPPFIDGVGSAAYLRHA
jgi:hypothetical protein